MKEWSVVYYMGYNAKYGRGTWLRRVRYQISPQPAQGDTRPVLLLYEI